MQTPLHGPNHQQTRSTQPVNEVLSTDASQEHVRVPRQSPRVAHRLAQNICDVFV
jgi:hypothetical protein